MQEMSEFMSHQRVIAYYVLDKLICDYHQVGIVYIVQRLGFPFWQTAVNNSDVTMKCHLSAQPTYTAFNMG